MGGIAIFFAVMEQVLPVESVPYDPSVEITGDVSQMSAEQYLSWVRDQSARLPNVFRASDAQIERERQKEAERLRLRRESEIQRQRERGRESSSGEREREGDTEVEREIPQCSVDLLPSLEWERDMIHSFSELRTMIASRAQSNQYKERLVQVPPMKDSEAWLAFCLGESKSVDTSIAIDTDSLAQRDIRKRKRDLAADLGIVIDDIMEDGEIEVEEVESGEEEDNDDEDLDHHVFPRWEGPTGVNPSLKLLLQLDQVLCQKLLFYLVDWLESNDQVCHASQWIYSILARVEKPLHRDTVACIRQLYRRCCILRKKLESGPLNEEELASLNMLISISGYYFGQGEYYVAFEPIVDAEVLCDANKPRNLLLEGSSDEDEESDSDVDNCMDDEENTQEDGGGVEERPAKWRATED